MARSTLRIAHEWDQVFQADVAIPPYTDFVPVTGAHPLEIRRPGMLLRLRPKQNRDSRGVEESIEYVLAKWSHLTVLLHFDHGLDSASLRLATCAAKAGIRAFVVGEEPLIPTLREQLTSNGEIGIDVVRWLRRQRVRIPQVPGALISAIVNAGHTHRSLGDFLCHIHESDRVARARLLKHGLQNPASWFRLGKGLAAALSLQAMSRHGAKMHATHHFNSAAALTLALNSLFSVSSSQVEDTIGLDFLIASWAWKYNYGARGPLTKGAPLTRCSSDTA